MSTIMNKQQSGLTKKYNRLVKLYNHNKIQLEVCKDTFKEMKNERNHFCYQYAYMRKEIIEGVTSKLNRWEVLGKRWFKISIISNIIWLIICVGLIIMMIN